MTNTYKIDGNEIEGSVSILEDGGIALLVQMGELCAILELSAKDEKYTIANAGVSIGGAKLSERGESIIAGSEIGAIEELLNMFSGLGITFTNMAHMAISMAIMCGWREPTLAESFVAGLVREHKEDTINV